MPVFVLPFPAIDPILIEIGPLAIRWYSLAYVLGLLLGWRYARRLVAVDSLWAGRQHPNAVDIDDFLLWAAIGLIVGGRLGYALFYGGSAFWSDPWRILQVWQGGMAFHGGFLGAVVAMIIYARARSLSIWSLFDVIAAAAPIGLFFGRIANFINGELFGRATDVPWAVVFPGGGPISRHPSQLYEALLEGLLLFAVLAMLIRRGMLQRPGFIAGSFALGYGLSRIAVELFRMPDAHIGFLAGGLTMGIVLSLPMCLAGVIAMVLAARGAGTKPEPRR